MSPVNQLSILAFAAGALAVPQYGQRHGGHRHHHYSHGSASGSGAPYGYGNGNATGIWGSTGFATGTGLPSGSSIAPASYSSAPASSANDAPTVTVVPIPASSAVSAVESYSNGASTSECTTDVTVTTTQKTYVTVTATEGESSSVEVSATQGLSSSRSVSTVTEHSTVYYTPSSSVAASSAVESSSSESSSSAALYAPSSPAAYTPATSSSSAEVSPVASSEAPSSSSEAAPTLSAYTDIQKQHSYSAPAAYSSPASSAQPTSSAAPSPSSYSSVASSATSSAPAATSSAPSSSGGKRGLAYNDASLTDCFATSPNFGYAYNWGSSASGFESDSISFIPTLWGTGSDFTGSWSDNAQSAIDSGSEYIFGFNEADMTSQANLSPEAAAAAWKQYIEPFAGKAKLCSPSVTNGPAPLGLTWLENFLDACSDCTIDCLNVHWYADVAYADDFKDHVTNATQLGGGKPVFVSEFAPNDGTDDDKSDFLKDVMPWMDSNNDVLGYFYFMVSDGVLVTGTEPSAYGSTYADYTGSS